MHNILSTKILSADATANIKANGFGLEQYDFINIKECQAGSKIINDISRSDTAYAVFTSANAVQSFANNFKELNTSHWKVFVLSGKTKQAALQVFSEGLIEGIADDASSLADLIIVQNPSSVYFFCGDKRREELPLKLKNAGIEIKEVIVYATIETPVPITTPYDAVLFFSPSAVDSFLSVNELNGGAICFAIGNTTAKALRESTSNKIIVSDQPTQDAMITALKNYFKVSTI